MSEFGNEIRLVKDIYNQQSKKLFALAQTLQNLLIIEKGTYPNQPNLGVGIGNYIMEILDTQTLNELQSNIEDQVEKFIQTEYAITVEVQTAKLNALTNEDVIICSFRLSKERLDEETISILIANDKNKKMFSKIII